MLQHGQKVSMEYTVFLEDGTQIDSNVGDDPLIFVLGQHQIFPALEEAVVPLSVGESRRVQLKPDQAYGPVIPDAFREVDAESVPENFRFAGAILGIQDPAGGVFPIRVHEVKEDKVVLDFNHPLAGKNLLFDVRILAAS